jgi:hypothetical protein
MAKRKKKEEAAKPEAPSTPPTKIENFTRDLRVQLKREEIEERADRAAHLLEQHDLKEAEFAEERKRQKSVLTDMLTELRRLNGEIRDKSTYRPVQCERRYLYDQGKLIEVRCDTGEIIFDRPLTEQEKQRELPFDQKGDDLDDEFGDEAAE